MSDDEELLCASENRDLYEAWRSGLITLTQALFIARRDRFQMRIISLPSTVIAAALRVFDALFEP